MHYLEKIRDIRSLIKLYIQLQYFILVNKKHNGIIFLMSTVKLPSYENTLTQHT